MTNVPMTSDSQCGWLAGSFVAWLGFILQEHNRELSIYRSIERQQLQLRGSEGLSIKSLAPSPTRFRILIAVYTYFLFVKCYCTGLHTVLPRLTSFPTALVLIKWMNCRAVLLSDSSASATDSTISPRLAS